MDFFRIIWSDAIFVFTIDGHKTVYRESINNEAKFFIYSLIR